MKTQAKHYYHVGRPADRRHGRCTGRSPLLPTLVGICALLTLLTGCKAELSANSVTVESLCGFAHTSDLTLGVTDEEGARLWAKRHLANPERFSFEVDANTFICYRGEDEYGSLALCLFKGKLAGAKWRRNGTRLTLADVRDGLGEPEFVYPLIDRCERDCLYAVELDYPKQGVSVEAWETGYLWPTGTGDERSFKMRASMRVTKLECYVAGSMEDALKTAFSVPAERIAENMRRRVPWPGFGKRFRLPAPAW
jgi:hypothetical protein